MERITEKVDVAVVGGGLAGLAAACYAGRGGRSVALFERSERLGGMAETNERHGFYFNMGAHALYEDSPAIGVLRELGVAFSGGSPSDLKIVADGKVHLLPAGPGSLLSTSLLTPGEKWRTARILSSLQKLKPDGLQKVSVPEWLVKQTSDPKVRGLIESVARTSTYANAPERLSMGTFVEQLKQSLKGVYYLDGGWQTLVDGLLEVAQAAGAEIVTGCRVEAVVTEAGRVTGVRLVDGSIQRAESVVIAAGPRDASRLVDEGKNSVLRKWAERAVPVKAACLDVALRRLPRPENKVVLGMDGPFFLTTQSAYSKVAPEGQALAYTLKYLPVGEEQDARAVERELEGWLDVTQPGWRDELIDKRYLPEMTVYNDLVTAQEGGTAGRPGPAVPGVEGLYVAGDWVGPVGLLSSASLWSGKLAAESIVEKAGHRAPSVAA